MGRLAAAEVVEKGVELLGRGPLVALLPLLPKPLRVLVLSDLVRYALRELPVPILDINYFLLYLSGLRRQLALRSHSCCCCASAA